MTGSLQFVLGAWQYSIFQGRLLAHDYHLNWCSSERRMPLFEVTANILDLYEQVLPKLGI